MPDHTLASLTIHSCPPDRVSAVRTIMNDYGLWGEVGEASGYIHLGTEYFSPGEFVCGDTETVTELVIQAAPEASFTIYEVPAYDGVGWTFTYVPELGIFDAHCDKLGEPLLRQSVLRKVLTEPATARRRALGLPWRTAVSKMAAGLVLAPDFYSAYWNAGDDTITVDFEGRRDDKPFYVGTTDPSETLTSWGFSCVNTWIPLDAATRRQVLKAHPRWYWFPKEEFSMTVVRRSPSA
ncbi:hypothetical protein [Nocardia sp. NRRL S-836]|uniref:hypothetical protein n=1 Tax=Nocardia sp. NRRL S-836 TaxID=1519492 RepID=UPI0006AF13C1|nr:hypothetical protein [Nocardia sp. NRRL S-836]KOV84623.1 hypothetical protein ADL03_15105 [Nocardia sp. NRRL S-836]